MRFLVQWIASERQGESVIPVSFWYWSIAGSVIMCLYFIFKRDPVGILAYLPNSLIYIRNLMLIQKGKSAATAAAPFAASPRDGLTNHCPVCFGFGDSDFRLCPAVRFAAFQSIAIRIRARPLG